MEAKMELSKEAYELQKQKEIDEIVQRFTSHVADPETVKKMNTIRAYVRELGYAIMDLCPNTRERATALTQLSFVMMSANSAIVQECPVNQDDLKTEAI